MSIYLHRSGLLGGGAVADGGGAPDTDPNFANVELLLHFDGTDGSTTFTDSSSNNFSTTVKGNAQIDTAQSKFGGASGLFDGTGDGLFYGSGTVPSFGSNEFTVEGWVRFNTIPATAFAAFYGRWLDNNDKEVTMGYRGASNGLRLFTSSDGTNIDNSFDFAWSPSTGTWYHFAFTRSGNNLRAFIDGTQVGSTETMSGTYTDASSIPCVACTRDGPNTKNEFDGWLDDLRVTIGVARYTANFTPPTAAFPNS